jgi:hypothetical protein
MPIRLAVFFIDREAFRRQPDRRGQRLRQGQAAIVFGQPYQAGRLPGNAGSERTVDAAVTIRIAGVVEIPVAADRRRRDLARVDEHVLAIAGAMQEEKRAAADTGAGRFDHGQGHGDRHRRVEGVAAGGDDLVAGLGRQEVRAGDRRPAGHGRRGRRL